MLKEPDQTDNIDLKKKQTNRPLTGGKIPGLSSKIEIKMFSLSLTLELLARMTFVTWQKLWCPAPQNVWSVFSVYLFGDAYKCQNPLSCCRHGWQPQRPWRGTSWLPAAGKGLRRQQATWAPSAGEMWLLPSPEASKTGMSRGKVSADVLRLLASLPETQNYTYSLHWQRNPIW